MKQQELQSNGEPLASGRLVESETLNERLAYVPGQMLYMGKIGGVNVGIDNPVHALVCAGSRAGKDVEIANTLLDWEGNLFEFSSKYNDATRLADRHGDGNEKYQCVGMGKMVVVLDGTGQADVKDIYKRWINPIGGRGGFLDPDRDDFEERAQRLAICAKPLKPNETNSYFPGEFRHLFASVCMYVADEPQFEGKRDPYTVNSLMKKGNVELHQSMVDAGDMPLDEQGRPRFTPHEVLFRGMRHSTCSEAVADAGEHFLNVMKASDQWAGVLGECGESLFWLYNEKIKRIFSGDPEQEFQFSEFKTNPEGVACFFAMEETMIEMAGAAARIALAMLEATLKTPGNCANGKKNLIWLNEFAALRRLDTIENGSASIAGYSGGTQLVLVVQSLAQIASDRAYSRLGLETLVSGCAVRCFFDLRETYTAKYVKELMAEKEVVAINRSLAIGEGEHCSTSNGLNQVYNDQWTDELNLLPQKDDRRTKRSRAGSHGRGTNTQDTSGTQKNRTDNEGEQRHVRPVLGINDLMDKFSINNENGRFALWHVPGIGFFSVERSRYWENPIFRGKYSKDPDHPFVAAPEQAAETTIKKSEGHPQSNKGFLAISLMAAACLLSQGYWPLAIVAGLALPLYRGFQAGFNGDLTDEEIAER